MEHISKAIWLEFRVGAQDYMSFASLSIPALGPKQVLGPRRFMEQLETSVEERTQKRKSRTWMESSPSFALSTPATSALTVGAEDLGTNARLCHLTSTSPSLTLQ